MNRLLLFLFVVYPLITSGQKLIKKPDVDKVTGDSTWKTSVDHIYNEGTFSSADMLESCILKKKNAFGLLIYISRSGKNRIHFSIQKKLTFKFTNNATLVLEASLIGIDTNHTDSFPKRLDLCWALYKLTSVDISILKDNVIAEIEVETSAGNLDYKIKEKNSGIIAKQVALITADQK